MPDETNRPTIEIGHRTINRIIPDALEAIVGHRNQDGDPLVYAHGDILVRLIARQPSRQWP
jgi:hypothetical protein